MAQCVRDNAFPRVLRLTNKGGNASNKGGKYGPQREEVWPTQESNAAHKGVKRDPQSVTCGPQRDEIRPREV